MGYIALEEAFAVPGPACPQIAWTVSGIGDSPRTSAVAYRYRVTRPG